VELGDARAITEAQPSSEYDIVVGDAFADGTVPLHLTTTEFMAEVRRVLNPGGSYLLNIIDTPPMLFFRSALAAAAETFQHVEISAQPEVITGDDGGNLVIHASDSALDAVRLGRTLAQCDPPMVLATNVAELIAGAPALTDRFAAENPRLNQPGREA